MIAPLDQEPYLPTTSVTVDEARILLGGTADRLTDDEVRAIVAAEEVIADLVLQQISEATP